MLSTQNDNQKRKKMGRPATGVNPMSGIRLTPEFRKEIQEWAAEQDDRPNLAEAMRRLIKLGLKRKRK